MLCLKTDHLDQKAPKARNMKARGKRERSERVAPGKESKILFSPEKGEIRWHLFRPFRPQLLFGLLTRGDALALLALAPGFHISRLWRFDRSVTAAENYIDEP